MLHVLFGSNTVNFRFFALFGDTVSWPGSRREKEGGEVSQPEDSCYIFVNLIEMNQEYIT